MNAYFWILIATIVAGFLGLVVRYCFASKCSDVSICYGAIELHRNTQEEKKDIEINNQASYRDLRNIVTKLDN